MAVRLLTDCSSRYIDKVLQDAIILIPRRHSRGVVIFNDIHVYPYFRFFNHLMSRHLFGEVGDFKALAAKIGHLPHLTTLRLLSLFVTILPPVAAAGFDLFDW